MNIFPDDYLQLANNDGIVANKSDTNLKVKRVDIIYSLSIIIIGVSIIY